MTLGRLYTRWQHRDAHIVDLGRQARTLPLLTAAISKLFHGFLGFSHDLDPAFRDHTVFFEHFCVSGVKCPCFY